MMLSNCCDAPKYEEECDICSECEGHCEFWDAEDEDIIDGL